MINHIVNEIKIAYQNGLYMSALSLALMLPDICGKVEYPKLCPGKRYKKWFEEYIGRYEKPTVQEDTQTPYLSDEVAYQLRCSVLQFRHNRIRACKHQKSIV